VDLVELLLVHAHALALQQAANPAATQPRRLAAIYRISLQISAQPGGLSRRTVLGSASISLRSRRSET